MGSFTYHGSRVGRHSGHDTADVLRDLEHVGDGGGIEQLVLWHGPAVRTEERYDTADVEWSKRMK